MSDVYRYMMDENALMGGMDMFKDDEGDYVLHSNYSSLLARHAALVEAVAWERECDSVWNSAVINLINPALYELFSTYEAARAEVDRLIAEGHAE